MREPGTIGIVRELYWRAFAKVSRRLDSQFLLFYYQAVKTHQMVALLLSAALPLSAQNELGRYEIFTGASYAHHGNGHLAGGDLSLTVNPLRTIGIVADLGAHRTGPLFGSRIEVLTYRFGPKVSLRVGSRLTIFGQGLAGNG